MKVGLGAHNGHDPALVFMHNELQRADNIKNNKICIIFINLETSTFLIK